MDSLELPLREWKRIAYASGRAELMNYVHQLAEVDGEEPFILHPVDRDERDTGNMQAVDKEHHMVIESMLTGF